MPYKVVQVTDTHLFRRPGETQKGVDTHATLESVVADIVRRHGDLDALLLTGDLSQDETPESYELLGRLLDPLPAVPIHAIPGNHENLDYLRARLEGDSFHVLDDLRLGRWRFAMLNSQVPGRVHGELGSDQINRLAESLHGAGEHVMVALHHPPVTVDSAWIDASRCWDGDALLAVLSSPPVKAVLCGHVHQEFETTRDGMVILTTPSTCVQFTPRAEDFDIDRTAAPGYRVFELEDDGGFSTRVQRVAV